MHIAYCSNDNIFEIWQKVHLYRTDICTNEMNTNTHVNYMVQIFILNDYNLLVLNIIEQTNIVIIFGAIYQPYSIY